MRNEPKAKANQKQDGFRIFHKTVYYTQSKSAYVLLLKHAYETNQRHKQTKNKMDSTFFKIVCYTHLKSEYVSHLLCSHIARISASLIVQFTPDTRKKRTGHPVRYTRGSMAKNVLKPPRSFKALTRTRFLPITPDTICVAIPGQKHLLFAGE